MAEVSTQIMREAPEIEKLKLGLMESAKSLGAPTLPGYQVAGFSPEQLQALRTGTGGIGSYMPYMTESAEGLRAAQAAVGQGTQQFTPENAAAYMNPYQQQVIDASLANINRQGDISRQNLQGQAVRAGAFGGSREGIQRAELERGLAETRNATIAQMMQQGYQSAQNQFNAEQGRALQGAQLSGQLAQGIGSLGGQLQGMGQQDVNFLYGLGSMQQQQQQRELDATRATELQSAYQPYQNLAFLSDIYKGAPSTQMALSSQAVPTPSPFQQAAGLITGGLATAAAVKQMQNLV